ncbi:hypothetical protein WICPIJ_010101 [Wickerhamomyces pijperi]|uniref:Uncharacterized protein n=1 Tax=Wickerhamomyces pijperi TaxID=599730 RepID=A0A9P8PIF0_WICPI|nr:hypothetical protein WICPIJ_010101 [Wickerhamomyces pijperi]
MIAYVRHMHAYPLSGADQAKEIASGSLALPEVANSGFNSSTKTLSCKLKTLMEEAVAAVNQYLFGEKAKAWTSSPAGKVYKAFCWFKSHKMILPSLPAEATKVPSGEMVMVETRDNGGRVFSWGELDGGDPVVVAGQSVHTLTDGVPDLDSLISGSRDNLSRVLGNGDG